MAENMDLTQGITKRLSYSEVQHLSNATQQIDVGDVIKALQSPSVDNFQRALQLLQDGCNKRFDVIQETAKEQSAGVGEADLRRMKRQFSSLKNTFLHYVVKDEFIAALADGLPNGTEEIQLAQFEEEANKTIERLRALKSQNEATQNEIAALIGEITQVLDAIKQGNASAAATLGSLQEDLEAAAAADAAMPPPLSEGLDEAECQAALAEEAAQARALEAQIASQMADLADLEAVLPREREETDVARAELADLEEQRAVRAGEASAQTSARFASSAAWAEESLALLEALGGVKVLRSGDSSSNTAGLLELQLSTPYPATAVADGSVGACIVGNHHLSLTCDPSSGVVSAAVLSPADVDASDIVQAAMAGGRGADFVVREVRSRLAGVLHRRALAQEAQTRFPGTTGDAAGVSFMVPARLAGGNGAPVHVQLSVEQSWPAGDDIVRVVGINPASYAAQIDAEKLEAAKRVRVEGRGVVAAVEAVVALLEAQPSPPPPPAAVV